ncbi:hypothetical protein J6590_085669 [Homalodisca vitripennis]|nr:hypothetical protein J6590_085669 [Homalodisca vitripennis]
MQEGATLKRHRGTGWKDQRRDNSSCTCDCKPSMFISYLNLDLNFFTSSWLVGRGDFCVGLATNINLLSEPGTELLNIVLVRRTWRFVRRGVINICLLSEPRSELLNIVLVSKDMEICAEG